MRNIDELFQKSDKDDVSALILANRVYTYLQNIKVGFKLFWFIQIGSQSDLRDWIYDAIKVFDPKIFNLCATPSAENMQRFNANNAMHQYWINFHASTLSTSNTATYAVVNDTDTDSDEELQSLLAVSDRQMQEFNLHHGRQGEPDDVEMRSAQQATAVRRKP